MNKNDRPTGDTAIMFCMVTGFLSVVLLAIGLLYEVEKFGEIDYQAIAQRWWILVFSGVMFQLALLLGALGAILKALWYLPGRAE